MRTISVALVSLLALVSLGCGTAAAIPPLTPSAQRLRAGKGDAEPSMREVGSIEAVNGSGCGMYGSRGSYEGALNELKNRAAAMNADYVQIYTITEPHPEPGCYDDKFVIRGTAFQAARGAIPAAHTEPKAAPSATCDPLCSPGFSCKAGACEPVCNPACEKGETCTRKRVCEPAPAGT